MSTSYQPYHILALDITELNKRNQLPFDIDVMIFNYLKVLQKKCLKTIKLCGTKNAETKLIVKRFQRQKEIFLQNALCHSCENKKSQPACLSSACSYGTRYRWQFSKINLLLYVVSMEPEILDLISTEQQRLKWIVKSENVHR